MFLFRVISSPRSILYQILGRNPIFPEIYETRPKSYKSELFGIVDVRKQQFLVSHAALTASWSVHLL